MAAADHLGRAVRRARPAAARQGRAASSLSRPIRGELTHAWRRIQQSRGAVRVADLADEVGWSRRHLTERFTDEYGIGPKQAARIERFTRARSLLEAGSASADVAARCGYADQAHLTREFRALGGCTPTQWRQESVSFVQDDDGDRTDIVVAMRADRLPLPVLRRRARRDRVPEHRLRLRAARRLPHPDDPGRIMHAQLDWPPGGGIMLGSSRRHDETWVDSVGRSQCYCVTETDEDVDALYERAVAAGATVVRKPEDQDYGGRGCTLRDPEGNQWSFGSYRGE